MGVFSKSVRLRICRIWYRLASSPNRLRTIAASTYIEHRDPDLSLHCILAGTVESLDPQVLLDPFEEELHLPALLVNASDGQRREREVVGQELQALAGVSVEVAYAPQRIRVRRGRLEGRQNHRLVRAHTRALVHRMRVAPLEQHVRLGPPHEEGRAQRQHEQPLEINVAAIHNIEGSGFRHDLVQHVDVMHLAIGNANKSWNIAAQVQQGVHLDGSFASPEPGPRKQRKTQIDGCRIQSIQALLQIDAHGLADIQSARGRNQPVGEVGEDTPVARFVSVCQRRACHLATESQVVQLALQRTQTGFDVAQTLAIGQLGEGHRQILIPTGEAAQPQVALITLDAATKLAVGEKADQLREDGAPLIHEPLSALLAFKSRQATNDFNLLGSYYLQPASYNLTGQQ